jgi:hypothetical protein
VLEHRDAERDVEALVGEAGASSVVLRSRTSVP